MQLVTKMTDEELRNEWYSLRDDSEHYDYRADGADEEDRKRYDLIQADIGFRMMVISIEEERRAEVARIERMAEENLYDRMIAA